MHRSTSSLWRTRDASTPPDWHLGHDRIRELCDRPFTSVEEMNETILRVNAVVTSRDTLVILGDVLWASSRTP